MRAAVVIFVGLAVVGGVFVIGEAAPRSYAIVVQGRATSLRAIVVSGKVYVPVEAVRAAGVQVNIAGTTVTLGAPGGAGPRPSVEGCIGQWLFNGIWSFRVTRLQPAPPGKGGLYGEAVEGWLVSLEVRNGANKTLRWMDTGIGFRAGDIYLVFGDGTSIAGHLNGKESDEFTNNVGAKALAPGALARDDLGFYLPVGKTVAAAGRPTKLLVEFNARQNFSGASFTVPNPSFRVRLDCTR